MIQILYLTQYIVKFFKTNFETNTFTDIPTMDKHMKHGINQILSH